MFFFKNNNTYLRLSPNIQESSHPNAIYTSRPLSEQISTVNSSGKRKIEESKDENQNNS